MSHKINKLVNISFIYVPLACTALMLSSCDVFNAEQETEETEKVVVEVKKPNYSPPINISSLPDADEGNGIDYIIDGSTSMCGYFNATPNTTQGAMPVTEIVRQIQSIKDSKDRILVFVQDESEDKANYIPFAEYQNDIMQGNCLLNGQYTELGIILEDYTKEPSLKDRSLAVISDMHFLPQEQTNWVNSYNTIVNETLGSQREPSVSSGLWSFRSPFVGDYYTVNNDRFDIDQVMKHIHLLWFTKHTKEANTIAELQSQLLQNPSSIFAQVEFLPQVKLLVDEATQYQAFSPPSNSLKATELLGIPAAGINNATDILNENPEYKLPYITAFDDGVELTEAQKYCYTINWIDDNKGIEIYPYPNASTNSDKSCIDDLLFRSKTGGTLNMNIPINDNDVQIIPKSPDQLTVNDGVLTFPMINHNETCVGVSTGIPDEQKTATGVSFDYVGEGTSIDTGFYKNFTLMQDNVCKADGECKDLEDKTYLYDGLIASFSNSAKQAIDKLYPKTLKVKVYCHEATD